MAKMAYFGDSTQLIADVLEMALEITKANLKEQRVYVPHCNQHGEIRQVYGDSGLIGIMLDNGTFIQTNRSFTRPAEVAIYKEECGKFPLHLVRELPAQEAVKTQQLALF